MAKVKCANCGEEMIEAYTRIGFKIFVCGHTKMAPKREINGIARQGEIYCKIDIQGLRASFDKFASGSNLTLEKLRKATKETVSNATLLEQANLALMLGLPADELATLFECSMKLGRAVGIPTEKAIEALCRGVGRRSRMILDNIGIVFKAKEAYDAYPNLDKNEAWQRHALKLIKEKAGRL